MRRAIQPHPVRRWIPFLLFLLLVVVFFGVVMLGPKHPPTLEQQTKALHDHQSGFYFVEGEILAQKAAPPGAGNWTVWIDHKTADVAYLGNGVWRAFGTVTLPSATQPACTWEAYMASPDAAPLFVRVGTTSAGDLGEALRRGEAKTDTAAPKP